MVKVINLLYCEKPFPKVIIKSYKIKTKKNQYMLLLVPKQFEFLSSNMDSAFYLI